MENPNHSNLNLNPPHDTVHGTCLARAHKGIYKDIFSALPNEIILMIFSHFLVSSPIPLNNHRAPALLIPVCRQFKDIVYGSPTVWKTIVLSERGGYLHLPDYLARSGEAPIDVTFYPLDSPYQSNFLQRAAPILAQSHRWRTVVVGMRQAWDTLQSLLPALENAPMLSSISMRQREVAINQPFTGLKYAIPDYSNLSVLDISSVDVNFKCIGTTHLRELAVKVGVPNSYQWTALSWLLNRNKSLRQVQLAINASEDQDNPSSVSFAPVSLPALTVFNLEIRSRVSISAILCNLDMPKLNQLSIGPLSGERYFKLDMTDFIATCLKRFNALKEIRLGSIYGDSYSAVKEDIKRFKVDETEIDVWVGYTHLNGCKRENKSELLS